MFYMRTYQDILFLWFKNINVHENKQNIKKQQICQLVLSDKA